MKMLDVESSITSTIRKTMDKRELARTTCFTNMDAFGSDRADLLADAPTDSAGRKKAKAKARKKFEDLHELNLKVAEEVAKQQSGEKKGKTTSRGVLRDAINADLSEWNATADAVADDLNRPEIMENFRVPTGKNDKKLAGRARAFIKAVEDLELHDEFVEHGLEDNCEAVLEQRVKDFEESQKKQSAAGQKSKGATDALDGLVETGMSYRKTLDALVRNLFKTDATIIGAWAMASHVERQPSKAKKKTKGMDGTEA